ncbi:hypothetical protein PUMCH_003755 [Australozyma saopauloensis]|uniref:Negative regulator of sporulation MDS3 n=1 Tax=Australozyma saopauloensis TaxID=291208 RepID=A0AAX4HCP1_9ASCO|nr:hypothetical protein PUMCH_003755 [[Candida] saopauloensis]
MTTPIPTSSSCYTLQLPPIEKDDRLNLNVRTGAAATLHNSFVFTYGGLTLGLELDHQLTIDNIESVFALKVTGNKLRRLLRYLSGELFSLDLISRCWHRVDLAPDSPKPKPRMFHEIATGRDCLYVFGGLVISEEPGESNLVPCNDLWEFNLLSKSWTLLHDGRGWETSKEVPSPRFSLKLTLIKNLVYAQKKDHHGLIIAGGKNSQSEPIYTNYTFDMVDKKYVGAGAPLLFSTLSRTPRRNSSKSDPASYFKSSETGKTLNVNYHDSVIVSFVDEDDSRRRSLDLLAGNPPLSDSQTNNESIIIYAPIKESADDPLCNPLLSYRVGKKIGLPRPLPLHKKDRRDKRSPPAEFLARTIPRNLRYPTGGIFGQNIVIVGFLPNELDVSIFIYNKPTGKWSRLNIFCAHEYGSHRFWGGFVWSSHHKVVLLGNYVTSRTTSSMRYFSSMVTVSLPVMNILTSLELAGGHLPSLKVGHHHLNDDFTTGNEIYHARSDSGKVLTQESEMLTSCEDLSSLSPLDASEVDEAPLPSASRKMSTFSAKSEGKRIHNKATFTEYVHYAAPKVKFTNVRSVFPPAAITLGRNAFDRYGDCISDFELISSSGDRIPVCLPILMERWGKYFVDLLSGAYVKAIDQFERDQIQTFASQSFRLSKGSDVSEEMTGSCSSVSDSSRESEADRVREKYQLLMNAPKTHQKGAPQFRLPFQDKSPSTESLKEYVSVDPHNSSPLRRSSIGLNISGSLVLYSHLKHIPAQLPLPTEPIPDVPATPISYRSSSRNNSMDPLSPRASLLHTLSVLRNIPKSPKGSPILSPRGSISMHGDLIMRHKQHWLKQREPVEQSGIATPQSRKSSDSGISPIPRLAAAEIEKEVANLTLEPKKLAKRENLEGKDDQSEQGNALLDFDTLDPDNFKLEPSLIPRKLYIPFGTTSIKAFAEFFYTGQVGNKWTLRPCALDCLLMARYFKVPLLYDLICEVLYGIIGRKEALVIKEGHKYKKKFQAMFEKIDTPITSNFKFPLDEFEGFLDTIDDGFLDLALLRKLSNVHKLSHSSAGSKKHSPSLGRSFDVNMSSLEELPPEPNTSPTKSKASTFNSDLSSESTYGETDEEPLVALHFLDQEERNAIYGRSKSIFEKSALDSTRRSQTIEEDIDQAKEHALSSTLESLVSPDAPEPSTYVIDLIYETASMCTDVKLMLRSMNARQMGIALEQTRRDYETFVEAMNGSQNQNDGSFDDVNFKNVLTSELDRLQERRAAASPNKKAHALQSTGSSGIWLSISPTALTVAKEDKLASSRSSVVSAKSRGALDSAAKQEKPFSMMRLKSEFKMSGNPPALAREETMRRSHTERNDLPGEAMSRDNRRSSMGDDDDDDDDDLQLIQTTNSRTSSRSRLFGKLRGLTRDKDPKMPSTDLKRAQSSASVFTMPSNKSASTSASSGKRGFFGLRKK